MGELFNINDIPGFQEALTAAMAVIHDDIRKRADVGAGRGVTIQISIEPDELRAHAKVKVNLPKQPGFDETLKSVALIRENGQLKIPVENPPAPFFDK